MPTLSKWKAKNDTHPSCIDLHLYNIVSTSLQLETRNGRNIAAFTLQFLQKK